MFGAVLAGVATPAASAALNDPRSSRWFDGAIALDVLTTIVRVAGKEKLSDLNLRMSRDSLINIARPLVKVALAIGGHSPATLLSRLNTFAQIAQRGVSIAWAAAPSGGRLTFTYDCDMPADVVQYAWSGVIRFGDELTGKTTRVDRFEVVDARHFTFHLSW